MESQGAALQQLHQRGMSNSVLLCGLDRLEHPYDVEDYLRHFGFTFPVFVDLNDESPASARASLGSVAILDQQRQRLRVAGKVEFDPTETQPALVNLLSRSRTTNSAVAPGIRRLPGERHGLGRPRIDTRGWSEPVRLGSGQYPRVISFDVDKAMCLWVTGELRRQQIEFAVCTAGQWQSPRLVPTGLDAHAAVADVDGQGRPVIAWSQKDPGEYRVYLSAFDGRQWLTPIPISLPGNDAFRPDLFCRPAGEVTVTWYGWKRVDLKDYPNSWWRSIYVCDLLDQRPGQPRELAKLLRGSDDCWDPVLTGNDSCRQVSWLRDENPPKLWGSLSSPAGWSPPDGMLRLAGPVARGFRVQAVSPLRSVSDRRGLVFEMVSPEQASPYLPGTHVYLTKFVAKRWTDPIPLSQGTGRHIAPAAVELADGNRMVFWCHLRGGSLPSTIRMRESKRPGQERDCALVVGDCANSYPSAAVNRDGGVWLTWQAEEENAATAVYVSQATRRSR